MDKDCGPPRVIISGGGGAGGCCFHTSYSLTSGTGNYRIIVGNGGKGRYKTNNDGTLSKAGTNSGDDTKAFGVVAKGGGQGGLSDNYLRALDGGCGGGAGARNGNGGWNDGRPSVQESYSGWTVYGNSGGSSGGGNRSGGGGGGIGGAGGSDNNQANGSGSQGGSGGAGRDFSSYFGTRVGDRGWFGGGGGGGTYRHGTDSVYQAPGNGGGSNYGGGGYGVVVCVVVSCFWVLYQFLCFKFFNGARSQLSQGSIQHHQISSRNQTYQYLRILADQL